MSMPAARPIRECGQVDRLEGELAIIVVSRAAACAGCAAAGVCHSLGGSDQRELRAVNSIDAQPGDEVEVEIPPTAALRAAVWVYLVPTLLMVATTVAFHFGTRDRLSADRAGLLTATAALMSLGVFIGIALLVRRLRGPDRSRYPLVIRRL
jgi:positive regulator of sigma E activity